MCAREWVWGGAGLAGRGVAGYLPAGGEPPQPQSIRRLSSPTLDPGAAARAGLRCSRTPPTADTVLLLPRRARTGTSRRRQETSAVRRCKVSVTRDLRRVGPHPPALHGGGGRGAPRGRQQLAHLAGPCTPQRHRQLHGPRRHPPVHAGGGRAAVRVTAAQVVAGLCGRASSPIMGL